MSKDSPMDADVISGNEDKYNPEKSNQKSNFLSLSSSRKGLNTKDSGSLPKVLKVLS